MTRRRAARRLAARGAVVALLLLVNAGPAHAAGTHWSFEVLEVAEIDRSTHRIELRPSPPGEKFPQSCATLVVLSEYNLAEWSAARRREISRDDYDRALTLLRQAQATGELARFGRIGRGFANASDSPACEVSSRGLVVVLDPGGLPVVFSLYEEPSSASFEPDGP